jgi:predicted TIM-barrel fold metal-dependent hydrolase
MSYATIIPMNVDTHFHIFDKNLIESCNSRYLVDYSASIEDWFKVAKNQGLTAGVIVQPSFLGSDNTLLLDTIKQDPKHLRGVGVVNPTSSRQELLELYKQGVCGVRLNLSDEKNPLDSLQKNQELISHLKALKLHLQIHHDDGLLNELLMAIPQGVRLVIDHFGRPKTNDEFEKANAGIRKHQENLWIKLSAQYRTPNINHRAVFEYWLKALGASKLLWGSDWPHTRHEAMENYESQMNGFLSLTNSSELRHQILSSNPRALYWS